MSDDPMFSLIDSSVVRSEWYGNERYYSVLDVVANFLNTDRKTAKNYYHVMKKRLQRNGETIPNLRQIKAASIDGKLYYTEFTNIDGVQALQKLLEPKIKNRHNRVNIRKDDEVSNFHPKLVQYLRSMGWKTQHHVRLDSESVIDVVAQFCNQTYIIECKPVLTRTKFYQSVGQVMCYRIEYGLNSIPAIASYSSSITDNFREMCGNLGITLISLPNE
ncbi:MAG: hypothetical protein U0694_26680 [Anaerolineae bacterium]